MDFVYGWIQVIELRHDEVSDLKKIEISIYIYISIGISLPVNFNLRFYDLTEAIVIGF